MHLHGQVDVEVDEEVLVEVLGDWIEGTVVDVEKKKKNQRAMVEYTWAGSRKSDVFERHRIRKQYEYRGLDYGRIWKSSDGQYEIEASIFDIAGESVVIIKPDLETITVPLNRLCPIDNKYVKKFKKQFDAAVMNGEMPARTPKLPDIENFSGGMFGSTFGTMADTKVTPLGSIPSYLKEFKQAGTGYNLIRKSQKLVAVMPVGGPEQLILMSFREKNAFDKGDRFQSQLYWVSLRQQKVLDFVSITHEDYAIDYHPQHRLLLTYNRKEEFIGQKDEPNNYTLWQLAPGKTDPKPIVRWQADGMSWASHQFGKIINDHIVVVKTAGHTYQGFDIKEKKALYQVKPNSFFDAPVVVSHDRQNLILPEDGRVSIVDATNGEIKMSFPVKDRHVSGANVNEEGNRLVAITERNVYVWDLQSQSKEPTVYPAPLIGSPFSSRVEWIDQDHILGQSHSERILYRLSLQLPVWSYKMDVSDYFLNRDPLTNMVIDGKLIYVARPSAFGGNIAVGAVQFPGPSVNETTASIDKESLYLMKAGVKVGLDVSEVQQDKEKVSEWLIEKIEANQWVYDQNADIVLTASTGVGEQQTVEYKEFGIRGKVSSASFKPHWAKIALKQGSKIIWQSGTSTGAPPVIHSRNAQAEVERYQRPQTKFFEFVKIESKILDPKYSRGFGVSKLGLRGIEVVSTSPPGREDDPHAAAEQADKDREKAAEQDGKQGQNGTTESNTGNPNGSGRGPGGFQRGGGRTNSGNRGGR